MQLDSKVLIDAIDDIVFAHDREGRLIYVSPSIHRLGYQPEELLGSSFTRILSPEAARAVIERGAQRSTGGGVDSTWELEVSHRDGRRIWMQVSSNEVYEGDELAYVVGIGRDISARKALEAELRTHTEELERRVEAQTESVRKSEQRFRELAEMFPDVIFETDAAGMITYANRKAFETFGYDAATVERGLSCFTMLAPEDAERAAANFQLRVGGELAELTEYAAVRKDGSTFTALLHSAPILRDGQPDGVRGLIIDISERKLMERQLRESEERYRLLLDNAPAGIYEVDIPNQRLVSVNDVMCDFLGYSREELLAMAPIDLIAAEDRAIFVERAARVLAGEAIEESVKYRVRTKDGRVLWALLDSKLHIRDGKPWRATVVSQDVTVLTELEEQLNQAQRMEALGTLAGGVAHDFNNLLMGIQGHVALLHDEAQEPTAVRDHADSIASFLESAAELTGQLLGLAQTGKFHPEPVEVAHLVDGCVTMFARTKKQISIHLNHTEPGAVVEADRAQIEQVLLNVLINAWQAMPDGGEIQVETGVTGLDSATLAREQLTPGRFMRITVRDSGVGMSPEVRKRIFEPFFTTKERGRGTGLGLASAYGIVKNHNGFIDVESTEDTGSTFRVFLPVSASLPKEAPREPVELPPMRTTTVLIVDDEKTIARILGRLVVRMGHEVLVAASGDEALDLMAKHTDRIEVVILDMVMPGMDGAQTFAGLRAIAPDIKIILSSGYSSQDTTTPELLESCDGFLQKPWTPEQLAATINDALA